MLAHWTAENRVALEQLLASQWAQQGPLRLDFAKTERIDSVGAALLAATIARAKAAARPIHADNLRPHVAAFLAQFPAVAPERRQKAATAKGGFYEGVGQAITAALDGALAAIVLASDLSAAVKRLFFNNKPRQVRLDALTRSLGQLEYIGAQAVAVIGTISFLVGVTVALQSAAQLRQFGATVFVVDLVGVSISRELGPLIAAIVVAGRSGAASAAQIATMVVTEEWDALATMAIAPLDYVVVPKLLAIMVAQPLIAVMASAFAIFGAFCVAVLALDITPATFCHRLAEVIALKDVLTSVAKSVVFGSLIVWLAAWRGLQVRGGADGVGKSATSSVVTAIFAIIVADAAFSFLFYYGS